MEVTPLFPPLFPPVGWWRSYFASLLAGHPKSECIARANAVMRPRDWMRFRVKDHALLSVPVEGGASALKNHPASTWLLSPKAALQARKIDATLATLYGSTPFYSLLDHEISLSSLIDSPHPASAVCLEAFRRVERVLGTDNPALLDAARSLEKRPSISCPAESAGISILEPLFTYGPEAIFILFPTF